MSYPLPVEPEQKYPEDDYTHVSEQEQRMHEENEIVMEHFIRGQQMINKALGL